MFIDSARIQVKAGKGGKGCSSFYSDKLNRGKKIRDGGDGGKGADVIIQADRGLHSLLDFRYKRNFKATDGSGGLSKNRKGRSGMDLLIRIPAGTVVKDAKDGSLLRDLDKDSEQFIVAKGGPGGRGNYGRKTTTEGDLGEARDLLLELKIIADVGLIGLPNAGKSTLIGAVSCAKSKVASYPFTTKAPILGKVERDEFSFLIADMPGLIKDSHLGKGLGDRFLKHVERTRILLHVIDIAQTEGRDCIDDYHTLLNEIGLYSKELAGKIGIVVANKIDLEGAEDNLKRFRLKVKESVFAVSALKGSGLEELIEGVSKKLQKGRS